MIIFENIEACNVCDEENDKEDAIYPEDNWSGNKSQKKILKAM